MEKQLVVIVIDVDFVAALEPVELERLAAETEVAAAIAEAAEYAEVAALAAAARLVLAVERNAAGETSEKDAALTWPNAIHHKSLLQALERPQERRVTPPERTDWAMRAPWKAAETRTSAWEQARKLREAMLILQHSMRRSKEVEEEEKRKTREEEVLEWEAEEKWERAISKA